MSKRRRLLLLAAAVVVAAVGFDASRAPAKQWGTPVVVAAIHGYQLTLSKFFAAIGGECRFSPSCSIYGRAVITDRGWSRGGLQALRRFLRCGPWTPHGTQDPPFAAKPPAREFAAGAEREGP